MAEITTLHRQEHVPETGASRCSCGEWEGPFTLLPASDPKSFLAHALAEELKIERERAAEHYHQLIDAAYQGKCGYSGMLLRDCQASICDCFDLPRAEDPQAEKYKGTSFADDIECAIHHALVLAKVEEDSRQPYKNEKGQTVFPDLSDIYIRTRRLIRDLATGKVDAAQYLDDIEKEHMRG